MHEILAFGLDLGAKILKVLIGLLKNLRTNLLLDMTKLHQS
ncbi:unknown protein [Simkania negevensis Z]|uniref:Uncharacterized protein n=1 Tax=Simkania negevensis (strain ATCC VR-1471 / DSM 27360 / Z) TaxID=331113 RepID=F8L365_SIMNZ|nr:unknown protein [Simkania negevensis Z]